MKKFTLIISSLAITAITFSQVPAGKIVLGKNTKFITSITSNGNVGMEMMGQNMVTVSESSLSSTMEVKDITPTSYLLTSTINKMKIKTKGGMGPNVDFDSDKKEDMDGEMGKTLSDEFKPTDTEVSFAGKEIEKKGGAGDDENMQKVMQSVLSGTGGGVSSLFLLIPADKKAGDSWTDSSNDNGMKITNNYTLKAISGKDATVLITSVSSINKTAQAQGAEVSISMDSKISSTNVVDITTGVIKEKIMTVEGKGNLSAAGQELPLTSKVTATMTVKSI